MTKSDKNLLVDYMGQGLANFDTYNEIIPVLDKIEKNEGRSRGEIIIGTTLNLMYYCHIELKFGVDKSNYRKSFEAKNRLGAIQMACVEFVKWFNAENNLNKKWQTIG